MAIDVTIRSHTALLQGGFGAAGTASSSKSIVVGNIDITTYTGSGEPLVAKDLGLLTIDGLYVTVLDVDGNVPTATNIHMWGYDHGEELLLLYDGSAGTVDATSNAEVKFVAFGDSARAPELT